MNLANYTHTYIYPYNTLFSQQKQSSMYQMFCIINSCWFWLFSYIEEDAINKWQTYVEIVK